jgi:ribosomal subunit interface protein
MHIPIQVTFRRIASSPAIEDYIRRRAAKLETFSDRIVRCRVTVEMPYRHHSHGKVYRIGIALALPGGELFVGRAPDDGTHHDPYAAVDDAFDDAARVLQDHVRKHRGDVKSHDAALREVG